MILRVLGEKSIRIRRSTEIDLVDGLVGAVDDRGAEVDNMISVIGKNMCGESCRIR